MVDFTNLLNDPPRMVYRSTLKFPVSLQDCANAMSPLTPSFAHTSRNI